VTDLAALRKRRMVMMVVNVLAAATALAAVVGYFKFQLGWALFVFVGALLVGFGAQVWFIAGMRRQNGGT
jgi:hypothetical protein